MGLFRRISGFLGFGSHEVNKDSEDEIDPNNNNNNNNHSPTDQYNHHQYPLDPNLPRKGFSVSVQVPVDKAHRIGPVLDPCPAGDGGVQGLQWYTRSLKIDEDGDVADEFLEEIYPETVSNAHHQQTRSEFHVKLTTKSAKARNPCLSKGTVKHYVKYQGQPQLVG